MLAQAAQRIRQGENQERNKQIAFFAVGVDGANMECLARITAPKRPPYPDRSKFGIRDEDR